MGAALLGLLLLLLAASPASPLLLAPPVLTELRARGLSTDATDTVAPVLEDLGVELVEDLDLLRLDDFPAAFQTMPDVQRLLLLPTTKVESPASEDSSADYVTDIPPPPPPQSQLRRPVARLVAPDMDAALDDFDATGVVVIDNFLGAAQAKDVFADCQLLLREGYIERQPILLGDKLGTPSGVRRGYSQQWAGPLAGINAEDGSAGRRRLGTDELRGLAAYDTAVDRVRRRLAARLGLGLHKTPDTMIAYHNVTGKGVRPHRDRTHEPDETFVATAIYYPCSCGAAARRGKAVDGGDKNDAYEEVPCGARPLRDQDSAAAIRRAQEEKEEEEAEEEGVEAEGGEDGALRVRVEPSQEVDDIEARFDRLVLLRADDVLHQVLGVRHERFSVTTWLSRQRQNHDRI